MSRQNRKWILLYVVTILAGFLAARAISHFIVSDSPLPPSPLAITVTNKIALPVVLVKAEPQAMNLDFEQGQTRALRCWEWPWLDERCESTGTEKQEINTPDKWKSWYVRNRFCPMYESCPPEDQNCEHYEYVSGIPEVTLANLLDGFPDPERVKTGYKALKWFEFWRCGLGGLEQRINGLVNGRHYRFKLYAHTWYSNCSSRPHDRPYEDDCETEADNWATIRIGLDSSCTEYYFSPSIQWSEPYHIYGRYEEQLVTPVVTVTQGCLTIWIEFESSRPMKHFDGYADNGELEAVP